MKRLRTSTPNARCLITMDKCSGKQRSMTSLVLQCPMNSHGNKQPAIPSNCTVGYECCTWPPNYFSVDAQLASPSHEPLRKASVRHSLWSNHNPVLPQVRVVMIIE